MKIFIVVPVFNEGIIFERWLPGLLKVAELLQAEVVVVDDGSASPLQGLLLASQKAIFLRHEVNCGVGAAIATGMEYAKRHGAEVVLTIDGDGQHDPRDLHLLIEKLEEDGADIVNGSRFLKQQWIPWSRRVVNFLANIITFGLSGFWVSDSQSGMKGFNKKALEKIEVQTAGYEWCSDIFREANWYGLRLREVPISVLYNKYSMSKGQNLAIGIDMVVRLAVKSLWK
jgi:glycosyltransferase involved in cell wall biosynthesis